MTTIERIDDPDLIAAASHLFDGPAKADATRRFVKEPGHHILLALDDDDNAPALAASTAAGATDRSSHVMLTSAFT